MHYRVKSFVVWSCWHLFWVIAMSDCHNKTFQEKTKQFSFILKNFFCVECQNPNFFRKNITMWLCLINIFQAFRKLRNLEKNCFKRKLQGWTESNYFPGCKKCFSSLWTQKLSHRNMITKIKQLTLKLFSFVVLFSKCKLYFKRDSSNVFGTSCSKNDFVYTKIYSDFFSHFFSHFLLQ